MSEKKKIITAHPDLFNFPKKNKTKKEHRVKKNIKIKTNNTVKNIKKHILEELRKKQEENMNQLFNTQPLLVSDDSKSSNDFDESLKYLTSFQKKYDEKNEKNEKNKNPFLAVKNQEKNHHSLLFNNHIDVFDDHVQPNTQLHVLSSNPANVFDNGVKNHQPQWGCLKNGNLPTFRTWKQNSQTTHNTPHPINSQLSFTPTIVVNPKDSNTIMRESALSEPLFGAKEEDVFKGTHLVNAQRSQINNQDEKIKIMSEIKQKMQKIDSFEKNKNKKSPKRRKTVRRTFHIGKSKTTPKISVLISNKTIRKNVTSKATLLKQTPIAEIRKNLIKKGLIKVGSMAPNDVLRKMYESVELINGDVKNHNPDNMLYNYFHNE
jgi:hypothetical protein